MKDETLLPDEFEAFAKREGLITESYGLRSVNSAIDVARKAWNAALQSGNSGQTVTVPAGYVLVNADFIDTVKQAFKEVGARKSFPGHAHDAPGIWDSDNGEKANKPCAQCAMWSNLHDILSAAPKAPDGWIPVSERMPPCKTGVLVATEMDGPGDWRMKWATYVPEHPDAINGWLIPGASWTPSHWQPLPDAPKGV